MSSYKTKDVKKSTTSIRGLSTPKTNATMRLKRAVIVLGALLVVFLTYFTLSSTGSHRVISLDDILSDINKKATKPNTSGNDLVVPSAASNNYMHVIAAAKNVSQVNGTVLVTVINDAYLPLTYSWLCNTKVMNIHKSILIITSDLKSKVALQRDWPEISVVTMEIPSIGGDQLFSHVGYIKIMVWRTELLNAIVQAGIEILLFEADSVWFANPVPEFQQTKGYDILVNPVSEHVNEYNGGFLYVYSTEKSRNLWKELTNQMKALGERLSKFANEKFISGGVTQKCLSALVVKRFGSITIKELPLDIYADGLWYSLSAEKRKQSRPIVVLNNWISGNKRKIDRAKKWKHWFIHEDRTCDMELVRKTVY